VSQQNQESYVKYYQYGVSGDYGFKVALAVSILLHLSAIAAMVLVHKSPQRDPFANAIRVTLSGAPQISSTAGRKTKAPVKRKEATAAKKPKPKPKPKTKKPASDKAVGLNREKTRKKPTPAAADPEPDRPVDASPRKRTDLGGTGGADDSGVAFDISAPNQEIEYKDIEFIDYYRTIYGEISRRWTKGGLMGGTASVRFKIHRDGSITGAEVVESAGKSYLDGPAMRAVMGARLPPLPQGFEGTAMVVRINFRYGEL